jgi:hypothetical protein
MKMIIFIILLIFTSSFGRPVDELENQKNLKMKIQTFKSKLAHLTEKERAIFSKKIIRKLRKHFYPREMEGPWMDDGEIFARML